MMQVALCRPPSMFWQPWVQCPEGDSLGKDLQPSARWRRDRRPCPISRSVAPTRSAADDDSPLDMSTRSRRRLEPEERSGQRGPSESDPVIDEHFRRSLGQDYQALFPHSSNAQQRPPSPKKTQFDPTEDSSFTPLTVDDHFAKALGDTWHRLQASKKDNDEKTSSCSSSPPASPSVVSAVV
ncbi:transcription cofactor vestigial-like protein 4 isoform X2 [Neocloeon triangulifer]|uniref:transcription cofactor vestigial-like protein 4 isoform X2 n=1 Tax=Neocloeon triangulifer TaxID=2078957 RepID=UPI00286EC734|nr:transcription cofactor vestigial-like protein 4 isoform X2 [Neocloeon triangulifer]